MSTITPAHALTIELPITLTSPLHHGAGTSGNTSILRTQEVIQPDGSSVRVPFVSAASLRHHLRDRLAWHAAEHVGFTALSKAEVDLLWTGGALTTTGAEVDLEEPRMVEEHYPALGLMGYAAQSDIMAGTLRASDLVLVCRENAWRLPPGLPSELIGQRAAAFRTEEFGTRHDVASSPVARLVSAAELLTAATKTTQMIWDVQALKAGSMLYGTLGLTPSASEGHKLALAAAVALWAPGGRAVLGAKNAQGFGHAEVAFETGVVEWARDGLARWTEHVVAHAPEIRTLIARLTR